MTNLGKYQKVQLVITAFSESIIKQKSIAALLTNGWQHCFSITQLYLILYNPMECSMPGFPVLYHLMELVQTHVH